MPGKKQTRTRVRRPRATKYGHVKHYGRIFAVIGLGLLVNMVWFRAPVNGSVLSYTTNTTISGLLAATNQERTSRGIAALSLNSQLNNAAAAKAQDMVDRDYWAHETPDGDPPWVFVDAAGYAYKAVGENLAYGFPDSASTVTGWMNSPGHRDNMLNTIYSHVGFGMANSENYQDNGNQTVVVAFYAAPLYASQPTPVTTTPKVEPSQTSQPQPMPQQTTTPAPAAPVETSKPKEVSKPQKKKTVEQDDEKKAEEPAPAAAPITSDDTSKPVSRLELLLGNRAALVAIFSTLTVSGLGLLFVARHSLAWHRVLVQGEQFVLHHKAIDIAIVASIVTIILLLQTIGMVR